MRELGIHHQGWITNEYGHIGVLARILFKFKRLLLPIAVETIIFRFDTNKCSGEKFLNPERYNAFKNGDAKLAICNRKSVAKCLPRFFIF